MIHAALGMSALALIVAFLTSTLVAELSGSFSWIATTKRLIAYALSLLVPMMIGTAALGNSLGRNRHSRVLQAKQRRMRLIAVNGLLVLTPLALVLNSLAQRNDFGRLFVLLQGIEFCAGATNVALMLFMVRDGFKLSGRFVRGQHPATK